LKRLDISSNSITIDKEGAKLLYDWLRHSLCSIEELDLSYNPLGDRGAWACGVGLTQNTSLRWLSLYRTGLTNAGLHFLITGLTQKQRRNTSLKYLDISYNNITVDEKGAELLGGWLSNSLCSIESLDISHNPLGDAGAMACGRGLATNPVLTYLSLAETGLTTSGLQSLFKGLETNTTLKQLDIDNIFLDEVCIRLVAELIETNRHIHYFKFGTVENFTAETKRIIRDALMENGVILGVLCRGRYAEEWKPLLTRNDMAAQKWEMELKHVERKSFMRFGYGTRDYERVFRSRGNTRWWTEAEVAQLETFREQKKREKGGSQSKQQRLQTQICIQCGVDGPTLFHELDKKDRIFCGRRCQALNYK
jgi:hypothetical protein